MSGSKRQVVGGCGGVGLRWGDGGHRLGSPSTWQRAATGDSKQPTKDVYLFTRLNFFTGGDILTEWWLLHQLGVKVRLFDPRSRRLHLHQRPSSIFSDWPLPSTLFPASVIPLSRPALDIDMCICIGLVKGSRSFVLNDDGGNLNILKCSYVLGHIFIRQF
jgi:hypothetical protein